MPVEYEWDVETVAAVGDEDYEEGEVIDHVHQRSYMECLHWINSNDAGSGFKFAIVLVRDDEDRRAWAYVEGGELEESFTDADGKSYAKVPKRFMQEVRKAH